MESVELTKLINPMLKFGSQLELKEFISRLTRFHEQVVREDREPPFVFGEFDAQDMGVVLAKKRVYIAHPFAGDPEGNREHAEEVVQLVLQQFDQVLPVSPLHLFKFLPTDADETMREDIMATCLGLLNQCDEVWHFGLSKGVWREIKFAAQQGIPVRRSKVEDGRIVLYRETTALSEDWAEDEDADERD